MPDEDRIKLIFYAVLASLALQDFDQRCPLLSFLHNCLNQKMAFSQSPRIFALTRVQVVKPPLSTLFWGACVVLIRNLKKTLCNFIPFDPFCLSHNFGQQSILLIWPLSQAQRVVKDDSGLIFKENWLLHIHNSWEKVPIFLALDKQNRTSYRIFFLYSSMKAIKTQTKSLSSFSNQTPLCP